MAFWENGALWLLLSLCLVEERVMLGYVNVNHECIEWQVNYGYQKFFIYLIKKKKKKA